MKAEYPDLKSMYEAVDHAADRIAIKRRLVRRIRLERQIKLAEFELVHLREALKALLAEGPSS